MIQSPLNYTGGKYRLLPQILPLFPENINTFVDMFCGGGNVGVNVQAERIILNDIDSHVIGILQMINEIPTGDIIRWIKRIIHDLGLSDSSRFGYSTYNCDSSKGLGKYNKEAFLRLRDYVNTMHVYDEEYYLYLFVLIIFAFNNQIRFNRLGQFNLPVGKRDFNQKMVAKLAGFSDLMKGKHIDFSCHDFRNIQLEDFSPHDFLYADPPYLITCATYNEKGGWDENREKALFATLDRANELQIPFALSNILSDGERTNEILLNWLNERNYICHHLNYTYNNSNYHKKKTRNRTDEVLITNY